MYKAILVDDENKIRSGLASLFPWQQSGFEITGSFPDGQAAYDYIQTAPVDLVLSDIRMPIMDGIVLARTLRQTHPHIKIVFFSSFQDFTYAKEALRNGVFDYLLKPVKYEELMDCLARVRSQLDKLHCTAEDTQTEDPEEAEGYYQRIINAVQSYIEEHFQTATLEQASQLVSLSPNYLSRIIKEHSELSFSDRLLEVRMKEAARMMQDVRYKQYEIAYRVGYENPKSFSRAFRQYHGVSPSDFRIGKTDESNG